VESFARFSRNRTFMLRSRHRETEAVCIASSVLEQVVDEKRKITASCKLMIETDALMSELDHQEYCVAWRRAWSGKSTFIDFIVRFSVAFRKLI